MAKICIVGLGNMGKAMFEILKKDRSFKVSGVDRGDNINKALQNCEIFIIAVKPQDFEKLCKSVKVNLSKKLAISIMAGVSTERIVKNMKAMKVVRVMPNLALRIKKALSGWFANEHVTSAEKKIVRKILKKFGDEIEVGRESKINAITALSGSGPAYFFKFAEILENAAKKYGFCEKDAGKIAEAAFVGAAELVKKSREGASALREKVTSKGGTTEAALNSMSSNNVEKIILEAIESARRRAEELNS